MAEFVQLTHTAQQVDDAVDAVATKADKTALDAEITAREAADTALGKRIDAKAEQSALTAETAAREAADTALEEKVDAIPDPLGAYVVETASGSVTQLDDGAEDIPLKSLVVQIEPVQEGSGDPSPDNVRPIRGWTGCTVSHSGEDTTNPTTYPISWESEAGTVYGGTLDVVTGEMVVDTIGVEYDGAESGWTQSGLYKGSFYRSDPRIESEMSIVRCSHLTAVSNGYGYRYGKCLVDGGHAPFNINLFIFDGSSTLDEFKSYLAEQKSKGTPVIVQYALTTPITYQLTPTEVRTLLGANNIWADCGNVSVTYRADPTILYSKIMAALQGG